MPPRLISGHRHDDEALPRQHKEDCSTGIVGGGEGAHPMPQTTPSEAFLKCPETYWLSEFSSDTFGLL